MGENSLTGNFQEKLASFMQNVNTLENSSKLPAWFKPFMESVKKFASDVSDTFADLDNRVSDFEGRLAVQKSVTDALAEDRERIQAKLEKVSIKLEDQLQYSRRNMILIHGVDESNGPENTDDIAVIIFNEMDVPIQKKDINRSHRLGGRNARTGSNSQEDREKKRPIIVSFLSYQHKKLTFDSKKKLRGQSHYITESLTQSRYALLQRCQQTYGKSNCWTYDGRIYCAQDNQKICITNELDLAERRT